jgi:hypothetical protein
VDPLRPPCWHEGQQCPNACARAQHARIVYNTTELHGPWSGWRLADSRLISPHKDWITAPVLDRLIYRRGTLHRID